MNFNKITEVYKKHLQSRALKPETIKSSIRELKKFQNFLLQNKIKDIRNATAENIESYFLHLKHQGYSKGTLQRNKAVLNGLFYCLVKNNLILTNPYNQVEVVLREKSGLKEILTVVQMNTLLDSINTSYAIGLRDRAMFELMYATGLRISELINLDVSDIDFKQQELLIRKGKNSKDRIVPVGKTACSYCNRWIIEARKWLTSDQTQQALFLTPQGIRISASTIRYRLKHYLKETRITDKKITPHSFRHSCATHLLENGADIRYVQELLGHETVETTVLYTRNIITSLKKTHKMYHPRENELYQEPTPNLPV